MLMINQVRISRNKQSLHLAVSTPTICVHSNDEVISHSLRLAQLVGVTIVDHVVAAESHQLSLLTRKTADRSNKVPHRSKPMTTMVYML